MNYNFIRLLHVTSPSKLTVVNYSLKDIQVTLGGAR